MGTGIEIAGLLKEYGPWGICAILLLALRVVVTWWSECMKARLDDRDRNIERMALALERQAQTNAEVAENMREIRESTTLGAKMIAESTIASSNNDRQIIEKLGDNRTAIEKLATARGAA